MNYSKSTQRKFWLLTPEQITEARNEVHEKARAIFEGDFSDALTIEEEEVLRLYYIYKIQDIGKRLKYSDRIIVTAVVYFIRFYLRRSMLIYDPQVYLITCLFLASKVEEAPVLASDLCSILKADSEPVLISEYTLLDGLQFHLNVFQPQNSLKAVKYELGARGIEIPKEVEELASRLISSALYTDAYLLFPPSQIALVALKVAGQSKKCPTNFFEQVVPDANFISNFQEKEGNIKDYLKLGMTKKKIDEQKVRELFEKLSTFYVTHQKELDTVVKKTF